MSAQPNPSSAPGGINQDLWDLLSDDQQNQILEGNIPADIFAEDTANFALDLIEQGGIPKGLNEQGLALWTMIETDQKGLIGLEIISNAMNKDSQGQSTFADVVTYMNKTALATIIDDVSSISLNGKVDTNN